MARLLKFVPSAMVIVLLAGCFNSPSSDQKAVATVSEVTLEQAGFSLGQALRNMQVGLYCNKVLGPDEQGAYSCADPGSKDGLPVPDRSQRLGFAPCKLNASFDISTNEKKPGSIVVANNGEAGAGVLAPFLNVALGSESTSAAVARARPNTVTLEVSSFLCLSKESAALAVLGAGDRGGSEGDAETATEAEPAKEKETSDSGIDLKELSRFVREEIAR